MIELEYTVKDPNGLHARPAGLLAKAVSSFASEVTVYHRDRSANAKKLIALLTLSVKCGDRLRITVSGEDEMRAAEEIKSYLQSHL